MRGNITPERALCVLASEEVVEGMPFITSHMSISIDGFVAGPDQSADNPLGIDGLKLHDWHLNDPKHPVDEAFTQRLLGPRGAYIMGRNMFGPVRGDWATPTGVAGGARSRRTTLPYSC